MGREFASAYSDLERDTGVFSGIREMGGIELLRYIADDWKGGEAGDGHKGRGDNNHWVLGAQVLFVLIELAAAD